MEAGYAGSVDDKAKLTGISVPVLCSKFYPCKPYCSCVARWLREDDSLRKEAGGLMDVFLGLWKQSTEHQANSSTPERMVDYRLWLVSALAGTLMEKNGREIFKTHRGWDVVWSDIQNAFLQLPRLILAQKLSPRNLRLKSSFCLITWTSRIAR